ncbi:MAG: CHAD domain-containing protein [Pleurocapsa sp.]
MMDTDKVVTLGERDSGLKSQGGDIRGDLGCVRPPQGFLPLRECSQTAIAKHSRKIFKYEAGVIEDRDPEDLHQMRVGIRRLRSAIVGFNLAVNLPPAASDKNIGKIGKKLGNLRDLDVLLLALANDYRSLLPKAEQKSLDTAIKSLQKQRKQALKQVRKILNGELYFNCQQALKQWLENPQYHLIADISVEQILPDLLLPQVSQLLLHPGWLVGIEIQQGAIHFPQQLDKKLVRQLLERNEEILHDLRKQAKRSRYNLELFTQFYGDKYQHFLRQIEQIQEVLGQIQDCYVLKKVLEQALKSEISEQLPTLADLLTQTRWEKWQEFSTLQKQFLNPQIQQEFRFAIIEGFKELAIASPGLAQETLAMPN